MTTNEAVTIIALFAGPIFGAVVAGWLQDRSETSKRKAALFRTLTRTRRAQLDPSYVEALNLIEVEFNRKPPVLAALRDLLTHYDSGCVPKYEEQPREGDTKDLIERKKHVFDARVYDEREKLFIKLTSAVGLSLGYKLEQLDLMKTAYRPQHFGDLENQQKEVREFILDIAHGKRMIPIALMDFWRPSTTQSVTDEK